MKRFAFIRRRVVEQTVYVTAANITEAANRVRANDCDDTSDERDIRDPTYRRDPDADQEL